MKDKIFSEFGMFKLFSCIKMWKKNPGIFTQFHHGMYHYTLNKKQKFGYFGHSSGF